jgi:hypothetical protein
LHDRAFRIRIDALLVQERLESVARALQVLDPTIDLLELVDGGGGYRADVDNSGAQSRGQRGEVGQLIQSEANSRSLGRCRRNRS